MNTNRTNGVVSEKAIWDRQLTEEFIKICVDELKAGNRPGTHLSKSGWKNLIDKFFSATGHHYNRTQLKNRWDNLKKDYGVWKKLLRSETGLGWDIERGTVDMSADWWAEKIKETPAVARFRDRPPIMLKEEDLLFGGTIATGDRSYVPTPGVLPQHMVDDDMDELENIDASFGNPTVNLGSSSPVIQGTVEFEASNSRRNNSFNSSIRKKSMKTHASDFIAAGITSIAETCNEIRVEMHSSKDNVGNTKCGMLDCMDILYNMVGKVEIRESDTTWNFALQCLFRDLACREIFVGYGIDMHK